jgi:hypothetical protein
MSLAVAVIFLSMALLNPQVCVRSQIELVNVQVIK